MQKRSASHIALSMTALLGWLLFVLGCTGWSAWSPDGKKILFSYREGTEKRYNVAVYDLATGRGRTLFVNPDLDEPASAQWTAGGNSALVFVDDGDHNYGILEVPIDGAKPRRIASVHQEDDFPVAPIPELKGSLFMQSKPFTRVDLSTGAVHTMPELDGFVPFPWNGDRLLYLRGLGEERDHTERIEVGEMTEAPNSAIRLFDIMYSDPVLAENGKLEVQNPATDPGHSRFAMVRVRKQRDDILLFDRSGFQRILTPKFPAGVFHIANVQWALDGKTMFASVAQMLGNDEAQWSIARISLTSGNTRLYPITRLKFDSESDFVATLGVFLQVALSPDGRTIAANATLYDPEMIAADNRALYLIEIGDRGVERTTKIPISTVAEPHKD